MISRLTTVQFLAPIAFALFATTARAQSPGADFQVGGGIDVRNAHLDGHAQHNALAPMLRVGGQGWFLPFLGVEVSLLSELDGSCCDGVKSPLLRFAGGSVALTARYVAPSGFWFRGALGYGGSSSPALDAALTPTPLQVSGLTGALEVGLEHQRFQGSLTGAVLVPFTGALKVTQLEPRLWLAVKLGDAGITRWWLGADAAAFMEFGGARYSGVTVRAGLGLRVSLRVPERPAPVALAPSGDGALVLSITTPEALPLTSPRVVIDGDVVDEPSRRYALPEGRHLVRVQHEGFRVWQRTVDIHRGRVTEVRAELTVPTGPGRLRGEVLDAATQQPVAGVRVVVGAHEQKTDAKGAFVFPVVEAGLVSVHAEAFGYAVRDEVVQLAPESDATLTLSADKLGRGAPAVLRGLVESRRGQALDATVTIEGHAEPVPLGSDGRFSVTLPAGTYRLRVSAPGFVAQTHRLQLSEGEQAVFHVLLLRAAP